MDYSKYKPSGRYYTGVERKKGILIQGDCFHPVIGAREQGRTHIRESHIVIYQNILVLIYSRW